MAEWVELTGEKGPQSGEVFKGGRGNRGGIIEAARVLPVPGDTEKAREHHIARALKVASLSPEAQDVARCKIFYQQQRAEAKSSSDTRGFSSAKICQGQANTPGSGH